MWVTALHRYQAAAAATAQGGTTVVTAKRCNHVTSQRWHSFNRRFCHGQTEREHSAPARLITRRNPAMMVVDDPFADRETQTRAVRFAMRGEGLEQLIGNLRRDPRASVLDFSDHFLPVGNHAQQDFAP